MQNITQTQTRPHSSILPELPSASKFTASVAQGSLTARNPIAPSTKAPDLRVAYPVPLERTDLISEHEAIDVFLKNNMVAHSVENYSSSQMYEDVQSSGATSFSYCSDLMRALRSDVGVKNLSSTILVHDAGVKVYRNTGILFNRQQADLSLFSKGDANSNVNDSGKVVGNSDFNSAEELIAFIATTADCGMNEVKANFSKESIVGVYFCKMDNKTEESVVYLKSLLLLQKLSKNILCESPNSGNLGLLRYDPDAGKMTSMKANAAEKFPAYLNFKQRHGKDSANAIAFQIDGKKAFD